MSTATGNYLVVTLTRFKQNHSVKSTESYAEWIGHTSPYRRLRSLARNSAIRLLSIGSSIDSKSGWIRFPYYHHVFSDEVTSFRRQLRFMRNLGDFIPIDDAVNLLFSGNRFDERYFCLTFDDGLKCCTDYAVPALLDYEVPACFYIVTSMVGESFPPDNEIARDVFNFKGRGTSLDFMSWNDCQILASSGMTIGSHGQKHLRLLSLNKKKRRDELMYSKAEIERELGMPCDHFCAPYGVPSVDFDLDREGGLSEELGYQSFATGARGANREGDSPFALKRDHLLAGWGDYQLQYFFSR